MGSKKHKDCGKYFDRILLKIKKEIEKVDSFFQENSKNADTIFYKPSINEKKEIIQLIKCHSTEFSSLLEDMKELRSQLKNQLREQDEILKKRTELCQKQIKQLERIEELKTIIRNTFSSREPIEDIKKENYSKTMGKTDKELQEGFDKIMAQYSEWITNLQNETNQIDKRNKEIIEKYKRNQTITKMVIKYAQEAFKIRTMTEWKKLNFTEYVFSNSFDKACDSSCMGESK